MLDAPAYPRVATHPQDAGQAHDFAPTPSGCRPDNQPLFKIVTETRGGYRPGSGPKPRKPPPPVVHRPAWYVLATFPKAERRAHAALYAKGFEAYLPLLTVRRPDRSYHTGALFPGYLFCRLDLSRPWHVVRYAPGVFSLLSIDGIPTPCPDAVLSVLQATEDVRATHPPAASQWRPGDAVSLARGYAMEGLPAVVTAIEDDTAQVAIMFLGQLRSVSVPIDCLVGRGE